MSPSVPALRVPWGIPAERRERGSWYTYYRDAATPRSHDRGSDARSALRGFRLVYSVGGT